jgi:hypothetical protein
MQQRAVPGSCLQWPREATGSQLLNNLISSAVDCLVL